MGISTLVRYAILPLGLGFAPFAAIVLSGPNPDNLSLTRLLVGFAAWAGGSAAAMVFADRKWPTLPLIVDKGPDCDRCGEPTGKPFLYNMPRTPWRCEPCEREVTDILFAAASRSVDSGLDDLLRRLGPPADRTTEK